MAVSSLSFQTAYQEVAGQLGLDSTDTNTLVRLKRWINLSYKDIVGYHTWSWLQDRESVTMEIDYTDATNTYTVAVGVAGTTATFSGAIAASRTGWFIQFEGSDDWYKITSHTAGASTATISPAFVGTAALTAAKFTIRKMFYSLSSSVEYIISCRQAVTNTSVEVMSEREFDKSGFPDETASAVTSIVLWGQDSSNNWTFTPYPTPSSALLLEFRFIKAITELSATSDTPKFPPRFDSILLTRAKMYGYEFINDDSMYKLKLAEYDKAMKEMKTRDSVSKSTLTILQSVDGNAGYESPFINFPSAFGDM